MNTRRFISLLCALGALGILVPPSSALAGTETDTSVMLRALGSAWQYQDPLPGDDDGAGAGLAGRLITETRIDNGLKLEFNLFQTWLDNGIAGGGIDALLLFPERSGALETNLSEHDYAHLGIDTLSLAWHRGPLDLAAGRLALNLATTFYLSANDVFAPFAARDFYRLYKAGVDGLRADYQLSELSSLHFYFVSGYEPDPDSDTGWSSRVDSRRHSLLLHYNSVVNDVDVSVVGGRLRGDDYYSTGLQGEISEWLGLRIEAQWRQQTGVDERWLLSHTVGLEHRFENSFDLHLELFRNGRGATGTDDYLSVLLDSSRYPGEPLYMARHYLALGASYELTPLWLVQGLLMQNLVDDSGLLSLSAQRSLSDEADLVLGLTEPFGDQSRFGVPQSEFGSAARLFSIEVRRFF